MIEHKKYKISDELITKFLYGSVTRKEADYILTAIKNDVEYKNFLNKKNILDDIRYKKIIDNEDENECLAQLFDKIENNDSVKKLNYQRKRYNLVNILLKTAAVLLLLIGIGIVWFYMNFPDDVVVESGSARISDMKLPDGTIINVNKNSKLLYPETFKGKKREVTLIEGEAYFDVKHIDNNPFNVKTEYVNIFVLGTEFNVEFNPSKGETEIIVQEGTVRISFREVNGQRFKPVILEAGRKCTFNQNTYSIDTLSKPNQNDFAWKTGAFVFNETPFLEALKVVTEEFNYGLKIVSGADNDCFVTAVIKNNQIESILEVFEFSLNIEASIENNVVIVNGEGCEHDN